MAHKRWPKLAAMKNTTTLRDLLAKAHPFVLVGAMACGSSAPPVEHAELEETLTEAVVEAPEVNPWTAMTGEALRDYVEAGALAGLSEVQEGANAASLDAWLAAPDSAPAIGGRASERLSELAAVAVAKGDLDRGEGIIRLVRAKAANRNQAFMGNTLLSEIARRRNEADPREGIAGVFRELPRTRLGSSTVIFQIFQGQEQLDAQLAQIQQQLVSLDTASGALYFEQILPGIVANREHFLAAIEIVGTEHEGQRPPSEYAFATVDLTRARDANPVNVAVWDVGTNPELFSEQLYTNENEQENQEDDDGNGLVDDIHGVVQDTGVYTHQALLFEPSQETLTQYTPFLQGIMDLRAGLATSEPAQQVLGLMRGATSQEALEDLNTNLSAVGEWAHGTHVAGIMLAGVPQARLSVFRSAWAGEARIYHHRGPTDEELAAERANVEHIAAYINTHGVKVVNASLGFSLEYVANELRHESDTYSNNDEVMARAHVVQAHRGATWERVFELCPNTLFVVAAGNSNQDVVEYGVVPASTERDNVLVVGAVDTYGQWATFTNSNPDRVRVFDFGVSVPSLIPDGSTVPLSGTSMASPNVANLAAKLYSLDANLTPQAAIEIIHETADPIAEPFNGRIANETAAIRQVRRTRRSRR